MKVKYPFPKMMVGDYFNISSRYETSVRSCASLATRASNGNKRFTVIKNKQNLKVLRIK